MAKNELEFTLEDVMAGLGNPSIEDNLKKPEPESVDEGNEEKPDEFENFDIIGALQENAEESEENSKNPSPNVGLEAEQNNTDSYALAFARYQLEKGNLTDLNEEELTKIIEEDGEDAAVSWLFQTEVDKNREAIRTEILSQYEEDVQEFLRLRDQGLDSDIAGDFASAKKFYNGINPDDLESDDKEALRTKVITDWYKRTTKFNDARIKKLVDNHVALGEDVEIAKEAMGEVKELIQSEEKQLAALTKKQQEEFENNHKIQLEELKTKIESLDEVLPGYKVNKQTKEKIHDMLVKPVAQDQYGNQLNSIWKKRMDDPFKFDTMVAYLDLMGVFEGKMDKFLKPAKNAAVSDLERSLKSQKFGSKPATKGASDQSQIASGLAAALGLQ